jgi:hypothetical protein
MFLLSLLLACTDDPAPPAEPTDDPDAVERTIGPAGGVIAAPGLRLSIPEGALGEEVLITVTPGADPVDHEAWSTVWHFEPAGLVFLRAATASFVVEPPGEAAVWWSDPSGVEALPSRFADGMVSARVWHFSTGWVGPAPLGETGQQAPDTGPQTGGTGLTPFDTSSLPDTDVPIDSSVVSPPRDTVDTDLPPPVIETGWPDPGEDSAADSSVGARFCPEGQVVNCFGVCVDDDRGNGQCERWLACERLVWDGGDCDGPRDVPDPVCPPGTLVSCWGTCEPAPLHTNGACDEVYACPRRDWDGGDCPLPGGARLRASVTIDDAGDLAQLAGVSQLQGALIVEDGAPAILELPDLVTVQMLTIRSDTVESVSLPALTHVTRDARVFDGAALATVSLPALRATGGDLVVWDDEVSLSVPQLAHVGHSLDVELGGGAGDELTALETVGWALHTRGTALPALRSVGYDAQPEGLAALPALGSVGGILEMDAGAEDLGLPSLTSVGGQLSLTGTGAAALPSLVTAPDVRLRGQRSVALPQLTQVGPLDAELAPDGALSAPALTWAGALGVTGGSVSAPVLAEAGEVVLRTASAELPALTVVRGLAALEQGSHELPSLVSVGSLRVADSALQADALVSAPWVDIRPGGAARLAALPEAELLDLQATVPGAADLPALRSVGVLTAHAEVPAALTGLRWTRKATIGGAGGLTLPALESVGDLTEWPLDPLAAMCGTGLADGDGLTVGGALSAPVLRRVTALTLASDLPDLTGLAAVQDVGLLTLDASAPVPAGLLKLDGVERLQRLTLTGLRGGPLDVALPAARELGQVDLSASPAVQRLALPMAAHVAGLELIGATGLTQLDLGSLLDFETALVPLECRPELAGPGDLGPGLVIDGAAQLTDVALPAVTWLERLVLTRATALTRLSLPQVVGVGTLVLSEQDDVAWADITSDQLTEPPTALELDWPLLATVDDLFLLHDRRFTDLELTALTDVTSRLRLHDLPNLTRVALPALEVQSAPGWLNFLNDPQLTSVELPIARTVGRLGFVNTGLTVASYPTIEHVLDHISIYDNAALHTVSLPAAQDALQLFLDNNPAMAVVELPLLATLQRGRVDHQGALQTLSLPSLTGVATALNIGGNPALTAIELPLLTSLGDLYVLDNPLLPECAVDPVAWGVTGTVSVSGNAPCPP